MSLELSPENDKQQGTGITHRILRTLKLIIHAFAITFMLFLLL